MTGFRGRLFDITVSRDVDADGCYWPSAKELRSETLGGNRDYVDLDDISWSEAQFVLMEELAAVEALEKAIDWEAAYVNWLEESYEDFESLGFDLGTRALVSALKAARCLPFYSCNGGAFGGDHHEGYPLVAFFCRPAIFPFVEAAAEETGAGLEYNSSGGMSVYGRNVDTLMAMASAICEKSAEIEAVSLLHNKRS